MQVTNRLDGQVRLNKTEGKFDVALRIARTEEVVARTGARRYCLTQGAQTNAILPVGGEIGRSEGRSKLVCQPI